MPLAGLERETARSAGQRLTHRVTGTPKDVKAKGYKSIVRPQFAYASTIWEPVTKSKIIKLESVQRRVARICCNAFCRTNNVNASRAWWEDLLP